MLGGVAAVPEDGPFPILPETGIVPVVLQTTPPTSSVELLQKVEV